MPNVFWSSDADAALAQLPEALQPVYLIVEVSAVIDLHHVERAIRCAAALAKLGRSVIPIVAGHTATPEADSVAQTRGVWRVLDGRDAPPV